MTTWTVREVPDQSGRTVVVTGSNTGIGLETARVLAERGASVILACRNAEKAEEAVRRIQATASRGKVRAVSLDLSDLASVAAFAAQVQAEETQLDLLILNAGVMIPPHQRTRQGFELQFGTNHLGHFALTAALFPMLAKTPASRVVVVSSGAHHQGEIVLDDLQFERRGYRRWPAYAQSKLANLLFMRELSKRVRRAGLDVLVTAAHPGWTATDLQRTMPLSRIGNALFAMKPADGALPTLRAAVDPAATQGSYYGPGRFFELNGPPVPVGMSERAKDDAMAATLWSKSEELTGVRFPVAAPDARSTARA